jgi:flagellar biosynthesis protein FlhB
MDNKEKQILVTIITLILIFAGYAFYVYQKYVEPDFSILNNFKFWGKTFLIFIPVTIVSQIIIHIVFAIINKIVTNEDIPTLNDERDKLIELKSIRISHWIFTTGFLLSMVTLVLEMPPYMMFITLIASGFISGIVSEIAKLYYYRKGV